MKIRLKTSLSGPDINFVPGDETDVFSHDDALRLIAADYAEEIVLAQEVPPEQPKRQRKSKRTETTDAPPPAEIAEGRS